MRSLRARLFVAILGTVLVAVGASLALGVVLTKSAVRETIRNDVESQAETLATQLDRLPASSARRLRGGPGLPLGAPPPRAPAGALLPGGIGAPGGPQPGSGGEPRPVSVLSLQVALHELPASAASDLRRTGAADGTAELDGRSQIYAARRVDRSVVLVTRPDVVSGDDFRRYLSALLIASGAAALLAAAVAALLARRLTQPLRRLGRAAGELAAGRSPEPVPREGTEELDELAGAFNGMSKQLALARDAERAVLLSVSHDLRTPLTSIRGYAEGIEDGTVEPREAAAVVGREAVRLERLVGDLLALARLRQGVLDVRSEPVDLGAVAREAEERLRPRAREAGVEVLVEGGPAPATADHGRALQAVSNLLDNAIRVSPRGGAVTVSVGPGELRVADRGPGIPEAELPRAFERFHLRAQAGRGSPEGAGLGLAIVHELTAAMGGSATVANLPDGGAQFTIRLPVQESLPNVSPCGTTLLE
ncbi:MAG TPA: HAMP domain-containing sensor histidine kinase [Solirubrobacterales bacterium]|jgi:two-component system sensor histidine kinase BaeS|nr:HAMP domain-containing sensor histidine kinase [Solirubrobacterales bacterium]